MSSAAGGAPVSGPHRAGTLPAAVVFDQDGTYLETESAWSRAEVELFARRGRVFTDEHKRELLGSSFVTGAATLERQLERPGDGVALMRELIDLVQDELLVGVEPMPGAVTLAADLRAAGVAVGLATNSVRRFVDRALAASGQAGAFDAVRTSEDVAEAKPAPDVYLAAAAALGVVPAACVAVEDSATGVASGLAAGMAVVGVPSVPGVVLDDAHLVVASLAAPALRAFLGLAG